jgi:hypothetical protein
MGYLPLEPADANRFFQVINRRYTRSSTIVTSNKKVSEWAALLGEEILTIAILDRLLHDAEVLTINGPSWRLRGRTEILDDTASPTATRSPTSLPRDANAAADRRQPGWRSKAAVSNCRVWARMRSPAAAPTSSWPSPLGRSKL